MTTMIRLVTLTSLAALTACAAPSSNPSFPSNPSYLGELTPAAVPPLEPAVTRDGKLLTARLGLPAVVPVPGSVS